MEPASPSASFTSHRRWRRAGLFGLGLLALAGSLLFGFKDRIALWVVERQIDRLAAAVDPLAELPDGLHVGLCGTGSPMVDAHHGGPCTAVVAGRRLFIVDSGPGSASTLGRMRLNVGQIEAVLITHFHSDHLGGLGDLALQRWVAASATTPLPIYGPEGLAAILEGFAQAYAADTGYRIAHHGERIVPPEGGGMLAREFTLGDAPRRVIIESPDLEVVAFRVDHGPVKPAVGYKFTYKDRSVVLSGDTVTSAAVEREARGVDLLVHEGLAPKLVGLLESGFAKHARLAYAQVMADIRNYHTAPAEAAAIAERAGARMLVFNHIVPPLPSRTLDSQFLGEARQKFSGPIHVGIDGDWFSMPAGSREIESGSRP